MACSFDVLGPLRVRIDDDDVTPRAPKERSLLALLIMEAGRVVSSDRIIDELWGGLPIDQARRVLWVRVAGLRKLLKRADSASLLNFVAPGYRLSIAAEEVDAHRFRVLVDDARRQRQRGETSAAADTLARALALWRGDALADAQGCLALEAEARRLTEARLDATEEWVDAELACGRHAAVLFELSRLVDAHPFRERLCGQHALCLHRAGRSGEALAACHALRRRLAAELGLEPGTELSKLEREILDGAGTDELGPPADAAPSRHTLPIEPTRFVGRTAELGEVTELIASYRLVTLTGVGGGGKTRLALEAVASLEQRDRDGVCLVELSPVRADTGVAAAVARALGVGITGEGGAEDDSTEAVLRALRHRQLLLVIDTAEHVIGGVARLVHQLLTSCRDVRVLVTSRELLGLRGEAVFAVPPLSLPPLGATDTMALAGSDAVTLFCERARAARPGQALSAEVVALAAAVCRRVDGIPLAIELAAARMRMLGAGQIAERLDDCFQLLTTHRSTGVPARHQTLRATLDWSYELLAPAEQTALRHLGVFPADFDLDAAIAVLDGTPEREIDGFTAMSRLVDKSLVTIVGGGEHVRYRLLDPIRQYAVEKLDVAGETERLRTLHRDVFIARQPTLWPLMTAQKRQEAYADRENFVVALEWSWHVGDATAALRLVVIQTSAWMSSDAEAREWLERVLAQPEPAVHPARASALNHLALSLQDAGAATSERVDELRRQAMDIAERVGDPVELAACQMAGAEIGLARGRVDDARALVRAALQTYEQLGLTAGVGWCHHFLGWIAVAVDDAEGALVHFERALETARTTAGGEWLLAHALADLAPLAARSGDGRRGLRLAAEAVSAARPFAVRAVLAMALARAAETAILAGELTAAGDALAELLTVLHDLGTKRWAADALELTAVVHERHGEHVDGALALAAAKALRAESGGVRSVAAEVGRTEHRLREALGSDQFAALEACGQSEPVESTMSAMAATLRLRRPTDAAVRPTGPVANLHLA